MLHMDRVQSKNCSETEPKRCWLDRSRTCSNTRTDSHKLFYVTGRQRQGRVGEESSHAGRGEFSQAVPQMKDCNRNLFLAVVAEHVSVGYMRAKLIVTLESKYWSIEARLTSVSVIVDWQVKERPDVGVYVKDLSTFVVNNADDMDRIMTLGNKNSLSIFRVFFLCQAFARVLCFSIGHCWSILSTWLNTIQYNTWLV